MIGRKLVPFGLVSVLILYVAVSRGEKVLYQKQSPYNSIVVTEDERGLRTLRFGRYGPRQSVVRVDDPAHIELDYLRSMLVGLAVGDEFQRILIVGLGGGTLPMFLHHHYPKVIIDVVDIDPEVVDVAMRFFGFREDATLRTHVDDGRRFIEASPVTYDLIFLDAYNAENIPYHLATREFLLSVRRILSERGIVVGNVWGRASNPLYDSMVRTYLDVFDELYVLDVRGATNKTLVALPWDRRISRHELTRRAAAVSIQKHFPFDLGRLAEYGFRRVKTTDPGGRVLRDDAQRKKTG